jgi:hypothetical protein
MSKGRPMKRWLKVTMANTDWCNRTSYIACRAKGLGSTLRMLARHKRPYTFSRLLKVFPQSSIFGRRATLKGVPSITRNIPVSWPGKRTLILEWSTWRWMLRPSTGTLCSLGWWWLYLQGGPSALVTSGQLFSTGCSLLGGYSSVSLQEASLVYGLGNWWRS